MIDPKQSKPPKECQIFVTQFQFSRLWLSSADDALKDHLSLQGIKSAAPGD